MLMEEKKRRKSDILDMLTATLGLLALVSLVLKIGFYISPEAAQYLPSFTYFILFAFIVQEAIRWFLTDNYINHLRKRLIENIFSIILLIFIFFPSIVTYPISSLFSSIETVIVQETYFIILLTIFIFSLLFRATRYNYIITKISLHPGSVFAISFAIIIFLGTLLLLLPKATISGISIIDALFTSTSAVCVTGLIVMDTSKDFTGLGQVIILFLIQIGGIGVMTLTTFFAAFFSGGMSMKMRIMMKTLLSEDSLSSVAKILLGILIYSIVLEMLGAAVLYKSLGGDFSSMNLDYLKSAIFHSISAFCNAGFSTYSHGLMDAETSGNFSFLSMIMILIILGGIGFSVLTNLATLRFGKRKQKRLRYQFTLSSKLIIITTFVLIVAGTMIFWAIEPYRDSCFDGTIETFFHSLFLSVTARTAGFNTTDIGLLGAPAVLVLIFLMWIGASPGSTGGGIKTSTFAIVALAFINVIRGKKNFNIFGREIAHINVEKAFMIIIASLFAIFIGSLLIIIAEPDKDPINLIFEVVSAISTVGLSRGLTSSLGDGGKTIIIVLMFVGRIGVLTFFLAFFKPKHEDRFTLPHETVMVG